MVPLCSTKLCFLLWLIWIFVRARAHVCVCACVCMRVCHSTEVAQRVVVPNLSWWPSVLSISHCLGEVLSRTPAWILTQALAQTHTRAHTHTENYSWSCHRKLCEGGRRSRQRKEGRAPMHGQRQAKMSRKKWSEIPDIKLWKNKAAKENRRGEVKPPRRSPDSLLSPIDSPLLSFLCLSPSSRSALLSLTCSDSVLALPRLTPSLLALPLLSPFTRSPTRPSPLPAPPRRHLRPHPSRTVTLESIEDGLCFAASLSSPANASVQRIKGRECGDCAMNHFHGSGSQSGADSRLRMTKRIQI